MHLLAGDIGRIDDGDGPVDLDQPPGDIVILSSADSELAALAAAAEARAHRPPVRLANLMQLAHPMSVDLYIEKTARHARLVVVRAMGGRGYWPHGLEQLRKLARAGGPRLVVVPGEGQWDASLEAYSTVPVEACRRMWRYLVEGGQENARRALSFAAHLIGESEAPDDPVIPPRAGFYWPGEGEVDSQGLRARAGTAQPIAAIVFYRAQLQGQSTAPIDALVEALASEGIGAMPVFVASLKDRESAAFLADAFRDLPPAIVVNTTAFAVSRLGEAHGGTVLDAPGRPVLQVVLAGSTEEAWRESTRGLLPRDLTMNVALPEIDGRLLTRAVSFKAEQGAATTYRPVAGRVAFVARQAAAWVGLAAKPAKDRRVAVVLSNYPGRDGRIANGVGLDTPESAARLAKAMQSGGYRLPGFPADGAALMARLLAGPTNARRFGSDGAPRTFDPASFEAPLRGAPQDEEVGVLPRPVRSQERDSNRAVVNVGAETEVDHTPHPEALGRSPSLEGREDENPGPVRGDRLHRETPTLSLIDYRAFIDALPEAVRGVLIERWGVPEADPSFADGTFRLAAHRFGNVVVGIQPARGYDVDPKATYHDPDLVPPHGYLAFYAWLRREVDAIVHLGKHGNLEWLPGKALGLSETCWPEVVLGATPLIYPFIVNDPGEGAQAKRRASAVIVDHLMPAMTRAEIHGPLAELETLIDEYYVAAGTDKRRRDYLHREIITAAQRHGLDRDLGIMGDGDETLRALDAHLCDLKEMQIRDGLHVLGASPEGRQRVDTLVAIARVPRSGERPRDRSLHRAIAADCALGDFDPLDCDLAGPWTGPRPAALERVSDRPWRTAGDTVERVELMAAQMVERAIETHVSSPRPPIVVGGKLKPGSISDGDEPRRRLVMDSGFRRNDEEGGVGEQTEAVLSWIGDDLAPRLDRSGMAEIDAVLAALDGRFVPPGPSGAPSRGRPDVLPTGRNFYSVDVRAVPTAAAWALGRRAADAVALRYFQDEGEWPRSIALSAWGTSNMRTGGDDIAQTLAFIGAEPAWEAGTGRVTGFRIMPLSEIGRPRIDVTLKISGMFRDAFPEQIDLIDSAMRAVAALDEDETANPIAAAVRAARRKLMDVGYDPATADRLAGGHIFGAKPGAYGAGLQALIDTGAWDSRSDLVDAFLAWGSFTYGGGSNGDRADDLLTDRLAEADAVLHNQDNLEHDILDSDDYYQFMGGLTAAVTQFKGAPPRVYHGDHSRTERPLIRSLDQQISRIVRGRAANPKWLSGVMRHGYKGAFEIAATVDYLFAFAAATDAVSDHHFDQLFDAYVADDTVRGFIAEANAPALSEIAARFREAVDRGLWSPRSNSAYDRLSALISGAREAAE